MKVILSDQKNELKYRDIAPLTRIFNFKKSSNLSDSDARSIFSDCVEEELLVGGGKDDDEKDDRAFSSRATNTDPHYLSIRHWHSAEWKTDRKPCREPRIQSAPLKVKAIKAYYHDYGKK